MVFIRIISFDIRGFANLFWVENYIKGCQCQDSSGWDLSPLQVHRSWPNINWFWRAFVIASFPVSSTEIAELIAAHTGHMVASFVLLNDKQTVGASFELKIPLQNANNSVITFGVFFMGRVKANFTKFHNAFCTKQVLFSFYRIQLGFLTIWTHFVRGIAQDLQILSNLLISLFEIIRQLLIGLALFIKRFLAILLGALNKRELVSYFMQSVVFQTILAKFMVTQAQFGEFAVFKLLVANSTLLMVYFHHNIIFMPSKTDRGWFSDFKHLVLLLIIMPLTTEFNIISFV